MKLARPFVRLPLRVDAQALADEVARLDVRAWVPHPEGAPGNTAVPLVAVDGDPGNDATKGTMRPTPHLATMPYTARILATLESTIGRTRLMRIEEEGELVAHIDTDYYWWEHLRVHVPVATSPDVRFRCRDAEVHMAAGEVWVFDTWSLHAVSNPAQFPRVHLVADTVGSGALWDMIEHPDTPTRLVDPDSVEPAGFDTESVNYPTVMSPWELERTCARIVEELTDDAPELAGRLTDALRPVLHDWRDEWARHGDAPEGWSRFRDLRERIDNVVVHRLGDRQLMNRLEVVSAFRQLALRPALNPDLGATRTSAAHAITAHDVTPPPDTTPPPDGDPVTITAPVFIVSSPRAGSTLLFETLARGPELATIGGESHLLIEGIPALHPSAHDWASNRLEAVDATPDTVAALHQAFAVQIHDRDGRRPAGGPVRMLEKTPKNSLRIPFLAEAFPDALFVYLFRDPRETISSMLDAWRSGRFVTYRDLPGWSGPPWSLLLTPGWRDLAECEQAEIVTTQWRVATEQLLDDLEALEPGRWCVASYDGLVDDAAREIERIRTFCGLDWDVDLSGPLPLSRHTLDPPRSDKWRRNADELEPHWVGVEAVAARAHSVFAAPPRTAPRRSPSGGRPRWAPAPAPTATAPDANGDEPFRSVFAGGFVDLLTQSGMSLLVSTYQSGRLIAVRTREHKLNTHFRAFHSPMGLAAHGNQLAIGTKTQVYRFQNQPSVTRLLDPPEGHDACFMPRRTHTTGDIRIHDLAFADDELWIVNTKFSCLATLDDDHSFVPRWQPPFVSALAPEDRCHLNGLAVVDGVPRYVTALGVSDAPAGWREHKVDGGVVLDVESGEVVVGGLCMPHSPRWYQGRLWVLESGRGGIGVVDVERGAYEPIATVPGFARGLSFIGRYALIGLSKVREKLFDGLPLTAEDVERTCGVWVVDIETGNTVAMLRFDGSIAEIFEVLPIRARYPEIVEPGSELIENAFVLPETAMADVPAELRR